jgi:hypothetical protein
MKDDRFLAEGEDQFDGPIAILRTFVLNTKVKLLSGLAELSYVAGRQGDEEWQWATQADDALIDAFFVKNPEAMGGKPRFERYLKAQATLAAAFQGGRAQREIDLALTGRARTFSDGPMDGRQVPEGVVIPGRALAMARAYATLYLCEIEFAADRHPHAVESEIWRVAKKVAWRHPVTAPEAAYCALKAFEDAGLTADWGTAAEALSGAASGVLEREAEEEDARERAATVDAATAGLFGVQE